MLSRQVSVSGRDHRSLYESSPYRKHDTQTDSGRSDPSFPINGAKISEVDLRPRKRVRELDTNMSHVDTGLGDRVEPPFIK